MLNSPLSAANGLPEHFGRYHILRKLGEGGMGVVYLAHDPILKREVALKAPFVTAQERYEVHQRFHQAAQAVAPLVHPNICPVYEAGTIDGVPYLTMAYIEGATLAQHLRAHGLPHVGEAVALVRKLALAMEEAHRCDVIHRDVKPSNVILNRQGEPILMDFGLARRVNQEVRLTRSRAMLGTPVYMAPEHVSGESGGFFDPRGDVYSLGVVLYELLTGRLPFEGANEAVVFSQILTQKPAPPSAHRPDLNLRLEAVCLRAIARKPGDRYSSMAAFAGSLARFSNLSPAVHARPTVYTTLQTPSPGRPSGEESWLLPVSRDGASAPPVVSSTRPSVSPAPSINPQAPAVRPKPRKATGWSWIVVAAPYGLALMAASALFCLRLPPLAKSSGPGPTPITLETEAEHQFRLGEKALESRGYGQAVQYFTEAVRLDPKYAKAFYYRGRAFIVQHDNDQALSDFTAALRIDPDDAASCWGRAQAYHNKHDYEEAVQEATEALRRQPLFPQAHVVRGYAYLGQGKDDLYYANAADAMRLFQKIDALPPPALAPDYADRSEFYRRIDQFDKAVADALTAVRLDPDWAGGYMQLASAYYVQGRCDEEMAAYRDGCKACKPVGAGDFVDRARMSLALDKAADAVADCDAALMLDSQSTEAYEVRARAWYRQGDKPKALANYQRAAQSFNPRYPLDYIRRANLHQLAEQFALARADADRALEQVPRLPAALMKRGYIKRARREQACGAEDFKQAVAVWNPRYSHDFLDRARGHCEIAAYVAAVADCEQALQKGLKKEVVQKVLACAYAGMGKYDLARNAVDQAIRLRPNEADLYRCRGDVFCRENRYREAVQAYDRALDLDPNDAVCCANRGDAHKNQSQLDDAIADYAKAIKLDPSPLYYCRRADAYLSRAGADDSKNAIADCDEALKRASDADPEASALAHHQRGFAHFNLMEYPQAIDDYTAAVMLGSKSPLLYHNRADAYEKRSEKGDKEAAAADEETARQLEAMKP